MDAQAVADACATTTRHIAGMWYCTLCSGEGLNGILEIVSRARVFPRQNYIKEGQLAGQYQ